MLLVLGYSLVSFASNEMGSALHRDFTLKNMTTHAVLDAQMNLTLTHNNVCATILPQRNHLLHDLVTRLFLQRLQYGIVVLVFLDAFVYAHDKHRQGSENP